MRAKILFLLFLSLSPLVLSSQTVSTSDYGGSSSIYFVALRIYLRNLNSEDKTLFFRRDDRITAGLPDVLEGYELKFLSMRDIRRKLKTKKSELILYKIFPMEFEDGFFRVGIIQYSVTREKRKVLCLFYEGGIHVYFSYDCEKKVLSVVDDKIKMFGI